MVCLTSCGSQGLPVYTVGARGWHPDRGLSRTLSPLSASASRSNSTSLASARTTASQLWAPANECQVGAPGEAAESLRGA